MKGMSLPGNSVLGIDTMTCPEREVFSQHEKDFHEGIATLFNTVYLKHRQKVFVLLIDVFLFAGGRFREGAYMCIWV